MFINQTGEYALRAAAYLALGDNDVRLGTAEIAEATSVPEHYLQKVMRRLVVAGICDSMKGHNGGFRLRRPPEEITLLDVLLAVDFNPIAHRCMFGFESCGEENPCPLHHAWSNMRDSFLNHATGTTLADIRESAEA